MKISVHLLLFACKCSRSPFICTLATTSPIFPYKYASYFSGITFEDSAPKAIVEVKQFLPAISSALVLGTVLGVGQGFVLTFLAGPVLTVMGVGMVR